MNSIGKFYVLYHLELGYLTFASYSTVTTTDKPNPRGFYTKHSDAARRQRHDYVLYHDRKAYHGRDIIVQQIMAGYEVIDEER